MFAFWKSRSDDNANGSGGSPAPAPRGAARPVVPRKRTRVIDVPGLIRQASQRVGIRKLLAKGKKDIILLSREKIEDLINRSVKASVEKLLAEGSKNKVTVAQLEAESKAQFDELLRKAQFTAKISVDPGPDILRLIKSFAAQRPPLHADGAMVVEEDDRHVGSFNRLDLELGRGLDVGTVSICAGARVKGSGRTVYNVDRNAFLHFRHDDLTRKVLNRYGLDCTVQGDRAYIVGDPAFHLATLFEQGVHRPMKGGMLSREEPEALYVVNTLVTQLLGQPRKEGEVCVYSTPADSVDSERNFIYHRAALDIMIRNLGYTPKPMLESHLIVFAELKDQAYTGVGISCGGGTFNVCVSYKGVPALTFSTPRGGDWIDESVGEALGVPAPVVASVKEGGMDLLRPRGRIEEAVAIYYRQLLQYTFEMFKQKMTETSTLPTFQGPVEVVCAGGTALAPGFLELFREEWRKGALPFRISEIRSASDPIRAVTAGCVQAALEEMKAGGESAGVQIAPAALERAAVSGTPKVDNDARKRLIEMSRPASGPMRGERLDQAARPNGRPSSLRPR